MRAESGIQKFLYHVAHLERLPVKVSLQGHYIAVYYIQRHFDLDLGEHGNISGKANYSVLINPNVSIFAQNT